MVNAYRPRDIEDALCAMEGGATVLAGGTDLMVKRKSAPGALPAITGKVVLVGHLEGMRQIKVEDGRLIIGAATSIASVIESSIVPEHVKVPLALIGSPSIRNAGTLGGNIVNASPAGDSLPMLYALDAQLSISSVRGSRRCAMHEFITGPGKTSIGADELLTGISIPLWKPSGFVFRKAGQRRANAIAKVSLYCIFRMEQGILADVRMAFGAVGPTVIRVRAAELAFEGGAASKAEESIGSALKLLADAIRPIDDLRSSRDYRKKVALNLAGSFLEEVSAR